MVVLTNVGVNGFEAATDGSGSKKDDEGQSILARVKARYAAMEKKMRNESSWMKNILGEQDGKAAMMLTRQKMLMKNTYVELSERNNTRMSRIFSDMLGGGGRNSNSVRGDATEAMKNLTNTLFSEVNGFPYVQAQYMDNMMNVSSVTKSVVESFKDFDGVGQEFGEFWADVQGLIEGQGGLGDITLGIGEAADRLVTSLADGLSKLQRDMRALRMNEEETVAKFGKSEMGYLDGILAEVDRAQEFQSYSKKQTGRAERIMYDADKSQKMAWSKVMKGANKVMHDVVQRSHRAVQKGLRLTDFVDSLKGWNAVYGPVKQQVNEWKQKLRELAVRHEAARTDLKDTFTKRTETELQSMATDLANVWDKALSEYYEAVAAQLLRARNRIDSYKEEGIAAKRLLMEEQGRAKKLQTAVSSQSVALKQNAQDQEVALAHVLNGLETTLGEKPGDFGTRAGIPEAFTRVGEVKSMAEQEQGAMNLTKAEVRSEVDGMAKDLHSQLTSITGGLADTAKEETRDEKNRFKDVNRMQDAAWAALESEMNGLMRSAARVSNQVIPALQRYVSQSVEDLLDPMRKYPAILDRYSEKVGDSQMAGLQKIKESTTAGVKYARDQLSLAFDGRRQALAQHTRDVQGKIRGLEDQISNKDVELSSETRSIEKEMKNDEQEWQSAWAQHMQEYERAVETSKDIKGLAQKGRDRNVVGSKRLFRDVERKAAAALTGIEDKALAGIQSRGTNKLSAAEKTGTALMMQEVQKTRDQAKTADQQLSDFYDVHRRVRDGVSEKDLTQSSQLQRLFAQAEKAQKDIESLRADPPSPGRDPDVGGELWSIMDDLKDRAQTSAEKLQVAGAAAEAAEKKKGKGYFAQMMAAGQQVEDAALGATQRAEHAVEGAGDFEETSEEGANDMGTYVSSEDTAIKKAETEEEKEGLGGAADAAKGTLDNVLRAEDLLGIIQKSTHHVDTLVGSVHTRWQNGVDAVENAKADNLKNSEASAKAVEALVGDASAKVKEYMAPLSKETDEMLENSGKQATGVEEDLDRVDSTLNQEGKGLIENTDRVQKVMVGEAATTAKDVLTATAELEHRLASYVNRSTTVGREMQQHSERIDNLARLDVGGEPGVAEQVVSDGVALQALHRGLQMRQVAFKSLQENFRLAVHKKLQGLGADVTDLGAQLDQSASSSERSLRRASRDVEDEVSHDLSGELSEAEHKIAELYKEQDRRIAELEADGSLSAEEKKAKIAAIRAEAGQRAAQITAEQEKMKREQDELNFKVQKMAQEVDRALASLDEYAGDHPKANAELASLAKNLSVNVQMLARHPLVWAPPSLAETNATATAGESGGVVTTAASAIEAMNARLLSDDDMLAKKVELLRQAREAKMRLRPERRSS